uniref:Uncharacterized protein n=1 Tax=Arundo donax TaxID=35708 RepID=A0A0A9FCB0_ARUDO
MVPPPPSAAGVHQEKDMAVDEDEKSKEMDASEPPSSSRKRPFSDLSRTGGNAVPNGSATDQHDESEDGSQKM